MKKSMLKLVILIFLLTTSFCYSQEINFLLYKNKTIWDYSKSNKIKSTHIKFEESTKIKFILKKELQISSYRIEYEFTEYKNGLNDDTTSQILCKKNTINISDLSLLQKNKDRTFAVIQKAKIFLNYSDGSKNNFIFYKK